MRRFAGMLYVLLVAALPLRAADPSPTVTAPPARAIGYTQHATDLPGGRRANVATGRAMLLVPGNHPVALAVDLADEPGSWTQFVGWFPDGKRIAYQENYRVWLADADGACRQMIDTGHPFNFAPAWSPDGAWLLYGSHRDLPGGGRARNLFVRHLADGVEVQLTHLSPGEAAMHGHWQPVDLLTGPAVLTPSEP